LEGPVLAAGNKAGTNRILQGILPLLIIAFGGANEVVEEAGLPGTTAAAGGLCCRGFDLIAYTSIAIKLEKQVHMMGHQHISP
jgi:hypothetical protein